MNVLDDVRLIVYRCHQKGLEILLIQNNVESDPDVWKLPQAEHIKAESINHILLEDTPNEKGQNIKNVALEGDWHDIPSIRGLIKHDVKLVKNKIKSLVPALENATYFTIKDAFKKVMPNEYEALKELKDIILDRNLSTNI